MLKCDDCGRFMTTEKGASSASIYSFNPQSLGLDYEHMRCRSCSEKMGPVQSNAQPHDGDMTKYQTQY